MTTRPRNIFSSSGSHSTSEVNAELNRVRKQRIEDAFSQIERISRRTSKAYLGQGFTIDTQEICHNKWPALSMKVVDRANPTANTPFLMFRVNDQGHQAMLEIITKLAEEQISLLDDNVFSQLPGYVEGWVDNFIEDAQVAAADLHEHNEEVLKSKYNDQVVSIAVDDDLALSASESEDVRRILGGIFGGTGDQVAPIVIDNDFSLDPAEAEKIRQERAKQGALKEQYGTATETRIFATHKHTFVANRYKLEKLLGTGGMGAVFIAEDQRAGKHVAIKILHPTLADDQKVLHRFFREASLIKRITHPNVIKVFDSGSYERVIYYAMEYLDGLPLHKLLKGRKIRTNILCNFALQIALGLEAIHRANIVHRDLKAENIVVTKDRLVKIIDFGIARPSNSSLTTKGEVIGSPAYLAPELWQGKEPVPASDIYALGIIFFRMIAGCLPFNGDNPITIMNKHLHEVADIPDAVREKTPDWFLKLIDNLLEKEFEKRPDITQIISLLKAKVK